MNIVLCLLIVCTLPVSVPGADAVAHPYDTVGFKNNGSGVFEKCRPPLEWDDASGKNVAWKTPMPSWSASSPIVVNDRVVTLAEPNLVLCFDLESGKEQWRTEVDQTELLEPAERRRARELYAERHDRFFDALALAAELKVLRNRLQCIEGRAADAFAGNFSVNLIDRSLRDRAVQVAEKLSEQELTALRARVKELEPRVERWMQSPFQIPTWPGGPKTKEWNEARKALAEYGYQFEGWYGHIGHTFATPVSDGKTIYVSMGWGQVASVGLDGKVKWLKWYKPDGRPFLKYTNSPILVGDLLIVIAGGTVRAFDRKTGNLAWEQMYRPTRVSMGQNHAGSPICVRVGGTDFVVTSHGRIYRASDGKVAARGLPEMVATPAAHGDRLFMATGVVHGTTGKIKAFGYRVALADDGTLTVKREWETPLGGRAGMWTGPTYVDGLLHYAYPQNVLVLDAETGKPAVNHVPNEFKYTSSHAVNTVAAGGYVFTGNCYGRGLVLEQGADGKPVACNQLESDLYRDHALLTADELREKWWSRDCFPTWGFTASTPFFIGNRMIVRSYEYLYCIAADSRGLSLRHPSE